MRIFAGWRSNEAVNGASFRQKAREQWSRLAGCVGGLGRGVWSGSGEESEAFSRPSKVERRGMFDFFSFSPFSLSPRRSSRPVERIIIYRLGSLGDTIVALPCLHKIAATFPHAERLVLTNIPVSAKAAPLPSLLAETGLIHGAVTYPIGTRSVRALWDLARRLRKLEASTLVYLTQPRGGREVERDYVFFRLCGFRRIIGVPFTPDLRSPRVDEATGIVERECSRLARTLSSLGPIDLDDPASWDLRLTAPERAVGASVLAPFEGRPFIAINMGGKSVRNHWGSENWRDVFNAFARTHGGFGVLAVGGPEDAAAVGEVFAGWTGPVVNVCGTLSPRETAAALETASLFVGHDSGPMHLAAACGVRCVALFGSRNAPQLWHPYGHDHKIIHNRDGIEAIGVDEVLAALRESLPAIPAEKVDAA